jgi:TPR repeat protein
VSDTDEEGLRAADGDSAAMLEVGFAAYAAGREEEAETCWRRAADFGEPVAMHNLGVISIRAGDEATARHWWQRAATIDYTPSIIRLGLLDSEDERFDEALSSFEKAASLGDETAWYILAWISAQGGDAAATRWSLEEAGFFGRHESEYLDGLNEDEWDLDELRNVIEATLVRLASEEGDDQKRIRGQVDDFKSWWRRTGKPNSL